MAASDRRESSSLAFGLEHRTSKVERLFSSSAEKKKTGFYFLNADIKELGNDIPGVAAQGSTAAYDFNFGGHFLEGASAYYMAAALVASFNGRAFDPQSGKWLDSKELQKVAGEMEAMGASEKGVDG
jgi:hypothetical protein